MSIKLIDLYEISDGKDKFFFVAVKIFLSDSNS